MKRLTHTTKRFSASVPHTLSVLLCLGLYLGVYSAASSKTFLTDGPPGSPKSEAEPPASLPYGKAKSSTQNTQAVTRGTLCNKHSPLHPAHLMPERFISPALDSPFYSQYIRAKLHSLISLSQLQDRAPPCLA
jgi:hypothetical protein